MLILSSIECQNKSLSLELKHWSKKYVEIIELDAHFHVKHLINDRNIATDSKIFYSEIDLGSNRF